MSVAIRDFKGNFIEEFVGTHMRDLEKISGPHMRRFLKQGYADTKLIKKIVEELKAKENPGYDELDMIKHFPKAKGGGIEITPS